MKRIICIILLTCLFLCGCERDICYAKVHQPQENIVSIELLNSENDNELTVIYTLDTNEHKAFLDEFMAIPFRSNGTPPSTDYGPLAVRLNYLDEYSDVIGLNANWYLDSKGEKVGGHYWYHVVDVDDYYTLFSQYVAEDTLPRPDLPRYKSGDK